MIETIEVHSSQTPLVSDFPSENLGLVGGPFAVGFAGANLFSVFRGSGINIGASSQ